MLCEEFIQMRMGSLVFLAVLITGGCGGRIESRAIDAQLDAGAESGVAT